MEREIYWIKYYTDLGCDLVNSTLGGGGTVGRILSDYEKVNLSNKNKGKKLTEEHKRKIGDKSIGRIPNEEVRAKMRKVKENISDITKYKMRIKKYIAWLTKHNYSVDGLTDFEIEQLRDKIRDNLKNEERKIIRKQITQDNKIKKEERRLLTEQKIKNGELRRVTDKYGNIKIVPVMSDEQKEINRIINTGKKQSQETIQKRSETAKQNGKHKLKTLTEEQKQHLREVNIGKKQSQETKDKRSLKIRGDGNGRVKISEEDVLEIRRLIETNEMTRKEVSEKYNLDYTTVCKIYQRKLWGHVK